MPPPPTRAARLLLIAGVLGLLTALIFLFMGAAPLDTALHGPPQEYYRLSRTVAYVLGALSSGMLVLAGLIWLAGHALRQRRMRARNALPSGARHALPSPGREDRQPGGPA